MDQDLHSYIDLEPFSSLEIKHLHEKWKKIEESGEKIFKEFEIHTDSDSEAKVNIKADEMMTIYDFKRLVLTHFKGKQFFFEKEDAKLTNDKLVKDLFSNKSTLKITFQLHCWKTKISEIKIK